MTIDFVCEGGLVTQKEETQEEWQHYPFKYEIILPADECLRGVYVKVILVDDDQDEPAVLFVSAHKQGV